MCNQLRRVAIEILPLALILALGAAALGQRLHTVPVGTVIPLRMDTHLRSSSTRVGEPFTATVSRQVMVEGRAVVPEGTKVEGHVTSVTSGERGRRVGEIAVAFDRIVFPNGTSNPVEASLTTLSEEGRRKLEQDIRDREGGSQTRRGVVFIGGAGANATVGVAGGGSERVAVGSGGVGAILGTIGVLLNNGEQAEVQPGAEFGMMVERSFNVGPNTASVPGDRVSSDRDRVAQSRGVLTSPDSIRAAQTVLRDRNYYNGPISGVMNLATRDAVRRFQEDRNIAATGDLDFETARALGIPSEVGGRPSQTVFTSPESIRFAQMTLRDRGLYNGPINGEMTNATRVAIRQLQQANNLPITGDLDMRTARLLGIAGESGVEAGPIEILNPRAERVDRDSIRISMDVRTRGSGWEVFLNRFASGATLHAYVRGVPPRVSTGTATDHKHFTEIYNNLPGITQVIVHGPQRDFTIDLIGAGGGTGIGNPRQIAILASRLLQDYQRDLNIRSNRGQLVFDTARNFRPNEVEVLFQMSSLQASAELYSQLSPSVTDPDAIRGGAESLLRQARLLNRMLKRTSELVLSATVRSDWKLLKAEIGQISVTDADVENDTVQ
ncbi:MAG: peptidoglycan-binding protein [Blastocatellia bacterium]